VKNMSLIEPDRVYVMPSDKEMSVVDGKIKLSPRTASRKINLLIDVFFASLAEKHRENVIGIILSGSANDGTRGMKAIKYEGGLTFAQDDTAKFNSMPRSAIAAGVVDFVLPPDQIAKELIRISKHPYIRLNGNRKKEDEIDNDSTELKSILGLLNKSFGVNFSLYKMSTIKRRILRRMLLYKLKTLKEYSGLLTEKKEEAEFLYNDLLINVTSFFRDPEACRYLKSSLFPRLLKSKKSGEALRIWVTACSTGEEAFSIAMMLLEIQERAFSQVPIQIFATDLSNPTISKARVGVYTKQEVESVSPKRLQRFFTRADGGYRISQTVRDLVVFAPHNVLSDPPFSRIDFISCCNLLIYFDIVAQKKALATFHYSLKNEGYLMLGKSETISASAQLFSAFHKKLKIFSRKKNSGTGILPMPDTRFSRLPATVEQVSGPQNKVLKSGSNTNGLDSAVNSLLLSRFVPASVVINQQMEILQFRGSTSLFLEHPEGRATLNILKMARPEIAFELRNAISKAFKTKKPALKKGIELNGGRIMLTLEAVPLNTDWDEPVLLILFKQLELEEQSTDAKRTKNTQAANERKIMKLEEEMAAYRDELRSISHNHEASMEELESANEEVVSSNEELRSINEELETSKEEIQSANEELATTNQELLTRNELLNESYTFSEAIISTIHDPMIVLDKDLRVKIANKSFYNQFRLKEDETEGVLLYDLANRQWNIPKLRDLLEDIIVKNSSFKNFEIELNFPKAGKITLSLNGKRILQQAHREQLILLAISDVTDTVNRQQQEKKLLEDRVDVQTKIARASRVADEYIRNVFMQAPVSIVVYKGPSFIVDLVNEKAIQMWGASYEKSIGKPFFETSPELREHGLEEMLNKVYKSGEPFTAHEFPTRYNRGGKVYEGFFNFVLQPVHDLDGAVSGITAIGADVTQEVIARRKIEESELRYHNLIHSSTSLVAILDGEEMIIKIANDAILQSWDKGREIIGKPLFSVLPEIVEQGFDQRLREVYTTGKPFYAYELPVHLVRHGKKELVYYTFVYQPQRNFNGDIEGVAIIASEVTPQAIYREKIKESEQRYSSLTKALTQVVWITDGEGNFIEPQELWEEFTGQPWEDHKGWGRINMIHEDDRKKVNRLWEHAIQHKKDFKAEGRLWSKKHNTFRYFEAAGIPLENEQGKIKEWVGTISDVHEQKVAEEKLEDAARQFRFIADAMPQKVWTADAEGNRNYFNQQWIEYTGLSLEELKDLGLENVVHPEDLEKTQNYWKESIATGNEFELEIRLRAKNGKYQWHLSRGEAYRDENGKINLWVGTDTEIQKQKMQSLEFEDAVLERTKELRQKNLELRKINKQLESFTYISSHDLQEPLRKIQIFANRIMSYERQHLSEKGKEYFDKVLKASERMQILIEDLLAFSRISIGEKYVETTDLGKIIEEIRSELKEIIEEKNVTIEVDGICQARIIPFQFHQLIENLIVNAIKFADPHRSPHILIKGKIIKGSEVINENLLPDIDYCHISVEDNGIGFEHEFEEQIFELFQRLHGQDEYPGTGIGLAIAKKIVENHNGTIRATSEINKGTRFDIYLPADMVDK
jgi:PAS domain S-box-containing protein